MRPLAFPSVHQVALIFVGTLYLGGCLPPEEEDDDEAEVGEVGASASNTSSTPGTTSGFGFLPDAGASGPFECDVWMQDCPVGQKCMPWAFDGGSSWNATKCSPLNAAPGQPGDTCTVTNDGVFGEDSCMSGSMCWGVDETNTGTCVAFCTGSELSPGCENPATACSIANDGALILCLPICDPLEQNCAEGDACYAIGDAFVCAPDASDPDLGNYLNPCEYINACKPGLGCFDAAGVPGCTGVGCCTPFCDVTAPDASATCPGAAGGQQCVPYFEEGQAPMAELADVGVCLLPI